MTAERGTMTSCPQVLYRILANILLVIHQVTFVMDHIVHKTHTGQMHSIMMLLHTAKLLMVLHYVNYIHQAGLVYGQRTQPDTVSRVSRATGLVTGWVRVWEYNQRP